MSIADPSWRLVRDNRTRTRRVGIIEELSEQFGQRICARVGKESIQNRFKVRLKEFGVTTPHNSDAMLLFFSSAAHYAHYSDDRRRRIGHASTVS